jgi:hypothetical protein
LEDDKKKGASRRDFLKLAGTSAPAAAVALAAGTTEAAAEEAPSSLGLQKTDHVKKYLDSAKF